MNGFYSKKGELSPALQKWVAETLRADLKFVRPVHKSGNPMNMHMAFYGRVWDPGDYKYYDEHEALEASPLPDWLKLMGQMYAKSAGFTNHIDFDTAIVNWYGPNSTLGIHQDKDEDKELLDAGSPVVSFSIGSSAVFGYGSTRQAATNQHMFLDSGDVLVFGGPSRLIYHGIMSIVPNTCPDFLGFKNPGRLNITLRQTKWPSAQQMPNVNTDDVSVLLT